MSESNSASFEPCESGVSTVEDIQKKLAPFQPPADYQFEEELRLPAPRRIPAILRQGGYEKRWRVNLFTMLLISCICFVFSQTSLAQDISLYILPVVHLRLASVCLLLLTALLSLYIILPIGNYRYVRHGKPFVARVLCNILNLKVINGIHMVTPEIICDYLDPKTGKLEIGSFTGNKIFFSTSCEFNTAQGDYITGLALGNSSKDMKLYGLLDLNPNTTFLYVNGKPPHERYSFLKSIQILLIALVFCLFINIIRNGLRYSDFVTENMYVIFHIIVVGAAVSITSVWLALRKLVFQGHLKAVIAAIILVFGFMFTYSLAGYLNAFLDSSAPEYHEIEVVEAHQVTHNRTFREYTMDYIDYKTSQQKRIGCRYDAVDTFMFMRCGALEFHSGWLKFPFITNYLPAVLAVSSDEEKKSLLASIQKKTISPKDLASIVVIPLPNGTKLEPSPRMTQFLEKRARELINGESE